MTYLTRSIAAFALLFAADGGAAEPALSTRVAQQDGWVGYQVPMTADAGKPCCFSWRGKNATRIGCDLDGNNWGTNSDDRAQGQSATEMLSVYLHVAHGSIDKARAFAASCPVKDADRVRWLDAVDSVQSIKMLAAGAAAAGKENIFDSELAAIAMHADDAATPALAQLADPARPQKLREQAIFWLGQARGADGAKIVERVATTDADAEMRAHAVFALSEAHGVDGYSIILRIAKTDKSDHVREQALFWMAQMHDPRARADIVAAIGDDASEKVREQGVFALSQLEDGEADAALIALVRGNYPRKVKEQALFWLGQSGSTQALDFIDEVLTRTAQKATKS